MSLSPEQISSILTIVPLVFTGVSQVAAIFGKPQIVEGIGAVSKLWDFLAGNYRKASNAPKTSE